MSASKKDEGGVTSAVKATSAIGVLAAFAVAVLLNVVVSRQYKRWDMTSSKLYSLSEPTKTTLRSLKEPVTVNVLLAKSDPLQTSLRHLLTAYTAETTVLDVKYIDPDRDPLAYQAFLRKEGLGAARTEDGRVFAEASVVVVKNDKRWFLTPQDLVDSSEADEGRSRPKLEQGLTTAIRNVLSGERARVCFSKGHGELSTEEPGARGLGELKHHLDKNNTEVAVIDTSATDAKKEPWNGCALVYVAGPTVPFSPPEAAELARYVDGGGNMIAFLIAMLDHEQKHVVPSGLETVLAKGGIEARQDVVIERAPSMKYPSGVGETFFGQPKPHPITQALVDSKDLRLLFTLAQSLGRVGSSSVQPADLVMTSADAFAITDFLSARDDGLGDKRPGDRPGPLSVAMAVELPKLSSGERGGRMVIIGSPSLTQGSMWEDARLRGAAFFVESAISWATSRPQIVDIPAKPAVMAGMRLTEESVSRVTLYVCVYIPIAAALVGYAVYLRRRSTEKRKDALDRTKGP